MCLQNFQKKDRMFARETVSVLQVAFRAFSTRGVTAQAITICFFCGHFAKAVAGAGMAFVHAVEVSQ